MYDIYVILHHVIDIVFDLNSDEIKLIFLYKRNQSFPLLASSMQDIFINMQIWFKKYLNNKHIYKEIIKKCIFELLN